MVKPLWKKPAFPAFLGLVALAVVLCAHSSLQSPPFFPDELDVVGPVAGHLSGTPYPVLKYPGFVFVFYEIFLGSAARVWGPSPELFFVMGRLVTLFLYGLNICLMFFLARRLVDDWWALFAAALFAFSPVVFVSGIFIKTEGLLLAETLLVALFSLFIASGDLRLRWHLLAAVFCALAVTTKLQAPLVLVYAFSLALGRKKTKGLYLGGIWKEWGPWIFLAVFVAALVLTWPTLGRMSEFDPSRLASDGYFNPEPTVWRAVPEWAAFPFGRYSYALMLMIPFALGPLTYLLGILGLASGRAAFPFAGPFGLYLAVNFGIMFHTTLIRPPWMFLPLAPLLAVCAAAWLAGIGANSRALPDKTLRVAAAVAALVSALVLYPAIQKPMSQIMRHLDRVHLGLGPEVAPREVVTLMSSTLTTLQGLEAGKLKEQVEKQNPRYIVLLTSYMENICKYKENPAFAEQCAWFRDIIDGGQGYTVRSEYELDMLLSYPSLDPESEATLYLLENNAENLQPLDD